MNSFQRIRSPPHKEVLIGYVVIGNANTLQYIVGFKSPRKRCRTRDYSCFVLTTVSTISLFSIISVPETYDNCGK